MTAIADTHDPAAAFMECHARLFSYFMGDNEGGVTIPMTTPVGHNITFHGKKKHNADLSLARHKKEKKDTFDVGVGFYMPYMYQSGVMAAPKPKNDDICVSEIEEWTAHVRDFKGFPSPLK
jgi:hypothetical protein